MKSGFDDERLADLIYDALLAGTHQEEQDADLLMEATQFAVEEATTLRIDLDGDEFKKSELASRGSFTLSDVENHPIHGIMQQVCQEMLGISTNETITLMTSDILDNYFSLKEKESLHSEVDVRQKRGILGECEMCERCMMLTEQ